MFFGTARKEKTIKEMVLSIDQHNAWEDILGIRIKRFRGTSESFVNPLRQYKSTAKSTALLEGNDGIVRMYDFGHPDYQNVSLVDMLVKNKNISPLQAAKELSNGSEEIFIPKTGIIYNKATFNFRVSFDYRKWSEKDEAIFNEQGIQIRDLEIEKWRPICKLAFNSRSNPSGWYVSKPKTGYAIPVDTPFGTKHKIYCPGSQIKFLSTAPSGSVGGFSSVDVLKPIAISKSAKDHALLALHGINSRWIVNGEGNQPSDDFILWCFQTFPKGYFFYDNDTGMLFAEKAAKKANDLVGREFFTAVWIPEGMPKDPSDYYKKFGNINLIKKLIE
jgi:hypothetical protein